MAGVGEKLFANVTASGSETKDYTVPNGEILAIRRFGGNAGLSPDTVVALIWDEGGGDEEVIFCTHGDADIVLDSPIEKAGDGSKKLRIKLINDQTSDDFLGGFWCGDLF